MSKASDCCSDDLINIVFLHFLDSLFQKVHGFLFLGSRCGCKVRQIVSSTVYLEDLGTLLIVDTDKEPNACQRTHRSSLCIHLRKICHSTCQDRHWHGVSIVKCPLPSFISSSLNHGFRVGHGSSDAATNLLSNGKQMCYTRRFHKSVGNLFLSHNAAGIFSADSNPSQTRVGTLEAILHLI